MRGRTTQLMVLAVGLLPIATVVRAADPAQVPVSAYELCIEHSPVKAGTVSPKVGTHCFSANSVVTLSADPQPGYQFAYWIGDVSNPESRQTTVRVDTAKIVVAVFRSAQDDGLERKISLSGGGGAPSGLTSSRVDLHSPGFSISGGGAKIETVPMPKSVPAIPTPEPTTIMLLGLGVLALRQRRES